MNISIPRRAMALAAAGAAIAAGAALLYVSLNDAPHAAPVAASDKIFLPPEDAGTSATKAETTGSGAGGAPPSQHTDRRLVDPTPEEKADGARDAPAHAPDRAAPPADEAGEGEEDAFSIPAPPGNSTKEKRPAPEEASPPPNGPVPPAVTTLVGTAPVPSSPTPPAGAPSVDGSPRTTLSAPAPGLPTPPAAPL
jgi:hypothetical protein